METKKRQEMEKEANLSKEKITMFKKIRKASGGRSPKKQAFGAQALSLSGSITKS